MSEQPDVRAELAAAEARLEEVRARSARLEGALLKPTGLRNVALVTMALAGLGGVLGYLGAARTGDASAARELELSKETHEALRKVAEGSLDSCKQTLYKDNNEIRWCVAELDALQKTLPAVPDLAPRGATKCMCQPGDPLCSCL